MTAFDDAVRAFWPDHILVGLRASDRSAWQERGLMDDILEAFHLPVTVFEVDPGRARSVRRAPVLTAPPSWAGPLSLGESGRSCHASVAFLFAVAALADCGRA